MAEAADPGDLGTAAAVSCSLVRTERPWETGIDAIVISVGSGLGSLGQAVRKTFPAFDWDGIAFESVTPERPQVVDIGATPLRFALLATPHDGGAQRDATLRAIARATEAVVHKAAELGVVALGLPLLGAGSLGLDVDSVASVVVVAAAKALDEIGYGSLQRLVFLSRDSETEAAIRAAWNGESNAADLAGGVSSDRVDPNVGIPLDRDRLGVAPYVSMLATVIADRSTPLPLSVGVFGEWGSGKSYFMGLLREEVGRLGSSGNPAYTHEIVQIGFNAWHYADANLWASLGDEIFRQLAGPGPSAEQRRVKLREELGGRLEQARELEDAKQQAQTTVAKLQADVDKATSTRDTTGKALIRALAGSPQVWRRLGVQDEAEQGALLVEQLRGALTEADALRRAPKDRWGKVALAAAAVILLVGFLVAVVAPAAWQWLTAAGVGFVAAAGTGIAFLARARSGIQALRELAEELRGGMDSPEVAGLLAEIRKTEVDQRVAEAQLSEVVARVGEIGRQLSELTPGRNLYTFLAERARDDSYRRNLGLVSTIRKDFEQLVELMADWRAHPEPGGKAIDRIVLYIDDLDRCSSRQVVEVLEAVHLLLALELFVVVVGVDPRWLVRSLSSHYEEILAETPGGGHVTPEDYLEKIINLPLVLPGMSSGSLRQLLRSLMPSTENHITERLSPPPAPQVAVPDIEAGSEVDSRRRPGRAAKPPRTLTDREIDLLSALDRLVATPREAKRLFNLYRMLRATRDLSDASRFLGDDGDPGEYQVVVALLGLLTAPAHLLGKALDSPADPRRAVDGGLARRAGETTWAAFVADCEPRREGELWRNAVVGVLGEDETRDWLRLHRGLAQVSAALEVDGLAHFQKWLPVIRRFSYVLAPAA
ncbi:P-loop NTPase fold protein [Amycolatopsis rhabdoformis]|uniref:P-loop NTPase fold protein n=1 Tax=Amycolatopsis rhabdoformis TaxID=1448059 RepID=A0ABZ1HZN3_9PSEU|nr:P-loop NTPase fold protein [Amycolatopsis rhabdoformis]WSE27324.1 P-loop NTPase fold protein [Amycolatopsis rhabdoformis]